jgi:hypothetical protein
MYHSSGAHQQVRWICLHPSLVCLTHMAFLLPDDEGRDDGDSVRASDTLNDVSLCLEVRCPLP